MRRAAPAPFRPCLARRAPSAQQTFHGALPGPTITHDLFEKRIRRERHEEIRRHLLDVDFVCFSGLSLTSIPHISTPSNDNLPLTLKRLGKKIGKVILHLRNSLIMASPVRREVLQAPEISGRQGVGWHGFEVSAAMTVGPQASRAFSCRMSSAVGAGYLKNGRNLPTASQNRRTASLGGGRSEPRCLKISGPCRRSPSRAAYAGGGRDSRSARSARRSDCPRTPASLVASGSGK